MEVVVRSKSDLSLFIDRSSCSSFYSPPVIAIKVRFVVCSCVFKEVSVLVFDSYLCQLIHAHEVFALMSPRCDALNFLFFFQRLHLSVHRQIWFAVSSARWVVSVLQVRFAALFLPLQFVLLFLVWDFKQDCSVGSSFPCVKFWARLLYVVVWRLIWNQMCCAVHFKSRWT